MTDSACALPNKIKPETLVIKQMSENYLLRVCLRFKHSSVSASLELLDGPLLYTAGLLISHASLLTFSLLINPAKLLFNQASQLFKTCLFSPR